MALEEDDILKKIPLMKRKNQTSIDILNMSWGGMPKYCFNSIRELDFSMPLYYSGKGILTQAT